MNYPKERFAMDPQAEVLPNPPKPLAPQPLAANGVAEFIDAAAEDAHWRANYKDRPYIDGSSYDEFGPAYRYGIDSFGRYPQRSFDEFKLSAGWNASRGTSSLDWNRAKHAVQDAWNRLSDSIERAVPGDSDRDGK